MKRETEQMAAIADARQGSMPSGYPLPQRPFEETLGIIAFEANNRLAHAIDNAADAQRALDEALAEQQQTMLALAAVAPGHDQRTRGKALASRAGGQR